MLRRLLRQFWTNPRAPAVPSPEASSTRVQDRTASAAASLEAGNALKAQGKLAAALDAYRAGAAAHPENLLLRGAIANTLSASWRMDECIAACAEASALAPDILEVFSGYLLYSHYASHPQPGALADAHRRYGETIARLIPPRFDFDGRGADPERRLRVGYVSRDFCSHSVASFLEPVVALHDRSRYEVCCYYVRGFRDATTDRFAALADSWRVVPTLDARTLATRIHADGIDILVDLAGHTLGNRLAVFAQRPAPVQMTWLGYPDTTGVPTIDYRITDAIADPPGAERFHGERVLRLPGAFLAYKPPPETPPIAPRPRPGPLVFGCFNMIMKVNEPLLDAWARILAAVPESRMLMKSSLLDYDETAARLRERFAARGIAPERIELRPWAQARTAHLEAYNEVDIALDTYPYNGTTTTCEALWMGVPVVTLTGETHMSRVGSTVLAAAGLPEYIATNADDYVRHALTLAGDPGLRGDLARDMRARLERSALFDHRGFTRGLENAYREAWRAWCATRALSVPA